MIQNVLYLKVKTIFQLSLISILNFVHQSFVFFQLKKNDFQTRLVKRRKYYIIYNL